jgi:hypothetical protein
LGGSGVKRFFVTKYFTLYSTSSRADRVLHDDHWRSLGAKLLHYGICAQHVTEFGRQGVEKLILIKTNAPSLESKTVSDWIEDEDEDGFDGSAVNSSVVDMIELE